MTNIKKFRTEILVIVFLFGGIMAWIVIPPLFADTTIFLTTENGGTPQSCAPANGLVLAQNLTDLCDVTIISPATDQIIKYNGSQWVNVDSVTFMNESTTCNNIGSGLILCAGDNVDIKTLLSGSGITLSNDSNTVTITNSQPEATVCTNVGIGIQVFKDGNCNFRTILGSPDISITQQTNTITIDYNGSISSESTNCNNVGTGTFIHVIGSNCNAKSLKEGTIEGFPTVTITNDTNSITLNATLYLQQLLDVTINGTDLEGND